MGLKHFNGCWRAVGIAGLLFLGGTAVLSAADIPVVAVATSAVISPSEVSASTFTWRSLPNGAFLPGEDLTYVVRWGIITGGHSTLKVKPMDTLRGRPTYHIVTEAHSYGIVDTFYKTHDRNETWLDVQSLATVRYEKHISEGHYRVEEVIDLDQVNHRFLDSSQRLDKGTTDFVEGPIPPYVMDILGSLYYVRTIAFNVGDSFVLDVYDTKKIWPLVIDIKKRETVKVAAGKFDCYRVQPQLRTPGIFISKGKKLEVWMTADERHLPVMMRSEVAIGHVSAELTRDAHTESAP